MLFLPSFLSFSDKKRTQKGLKLNSPLSQEEMARPSKSKSTTIMTRTTQVLQQQQQRQQKGGEVMTTKRTKTKTKTKRCAFCNKEASDSIPMHDLNLAFRKELPRQQQRLITLPICEIHYNKYVIRPQIKANMKIIRRIDRMKNNKSKK